MAEPRPGGGGGLARSGSAGLRAAGGARVPLPGPCRFPPPAGLSGLKLIRRAVRRALERCLGFHIASGVAAALPAPG